MTRSAAPAAPITGGSAAKAGHVYAVDMVRVLTFACVIGVHTIATLISLDSISAGGAAMLLHFTRESFFALTAFVLVHRYGNKPAGKMPILRFWQRRYLLVGVPYLAWSVIYSVLGFSLAPVPAGTAVTLFGRNLLTGNAWYHLYFLIVTMQFYLIFPLFLWFLRATRRWHGWLLVGSGILQVGFDAGLSAANPSGGWAATLWHYDGSFVGTYTFYLLLGGVAAWHAERAQAWVRRHPITVVVAVLVTGAAAEGWYLKQVADGAPATAASDVFQPVMVPWCLASITALFALGVFWAGRRAGGPGSRFVEGSSDRSFGVFLIHPMMLWIVTLGPAAWLSAHLPPIGMAAVAYVIVVAMSLLVVELLRHTSFSQLLTGKSRSLRGSAVQSNKSEPSAPAPPVTLGAGRT